MGRNRYLQTWLVFTVMASLTTVVLSLASDSSESSETFLIFGKLVEHLVQSPICNQFSQGNSQSFTIISFYLPKSGFKCVKIELNEKLIAEIERAPLLIISNPAKFHCISCYISWENVSWNLTTFQTFVWLGVYAIPQIIHFSTYIFSADITPDMPKLCRVTKVKVFFLFLVLVFNFNLII